MLVASLLASSLVVSMDLAVLIAIVFLGIIIGLLAYLLILNMVNSQYLAYASSIRSWYPPVINNTLVCPQGYVLSPSNTTGLYQCGPCLVLVNKTIIVSCPR